MNDPKRIFSGNYSKGMWKEINSAKTVEDLRDALYFVCCRLQELEAKLASEQREADAECRDRSGVPISRRKGRK